MHRALFSFPRKPGLGGSFDGTSNGDAQNSVLLRIGQTRTLNAASPISEIRLWLDIYLKDDITSLTAGVHTSTVFFERHLGDVSSDFQHVSRISKMLSRFCRDLCTRLPTAAVFIVRVN